MRQIFARQHLGARTGDQVSEALRKRKLGEALAISQALPPTRAAAKFACRLGKVNRAGLCAEERNYLTQSKIENLVEIEALGGNHSHRIESVQFPIAAMNFIFRFLLFSYVKQKALVAIDSAGAVAGGEAAFVSRELRSVFAAKIDLEIADEIVRLDFLPEQGTLLRRDIA